MVDALASRGDEGRGRLRKAQGSSQTYFDPGMSEWGNPAEANLCHPLRRRLTQGTDTSKYLQERKSTETPLVAASEKGSAQTEASASGLWASAMSGDRQLKQLESCPVEGERPVNDSVIRSMTFQSSTGLVKPGVKLGGPPSKAKYFSTTDSEPVG